MIRVVSWKHKQGISNYGLGAGYSLPPAACVEDSWRLGIAISCNGNHRKMQRLCHIVLPGIVDCGEHPSRQRVDIFVILKFGKCTAHFEPCSCSELYKERNFVKKFLRAIMAVCNFFHIFFT